MEMISLISVLTLILILNISSFHASPTSVQIKAPSGRLIPHNLISSYLPDVPVHTLHERLHEVSSDLRLVSHNSVTYLNNYVGSPKPISHTDAVVYVGEKLVSARASGYIREGDGYLVVTDQEGSVLSVQIPGRHFQPVNLDAFPGLFVDVRAGDTLSFGDDELLTPGFSNAGVDEENAPEIANAEPTCRGADAVPQYVELAIAIDSARCIASGGAANAETIVRGLVDGGEALYRAKMCVRFKIVVVDIQCNSNTDPYEGIVNPLPDFRAIWPTRPAASIKRDVVLYATGKNYLSGVAGQAYVGVTCLQSWSFMWIDLMNSLVFAHEMGHNLNAGHTTTGVMKATINLGTDTFFASDSVDTIVAFVDAESSLSICIEAEAVPLPTATPTPSITVSVTPSPSASVSSLSSPSTSPTSSLGVSVTPLPSEVPPSPSSTVSPSDSPDPFPSPTPSTSQSASKSPAPSATASPSSQVGPPGERTCDSLLLERESYRCATIGGVYKISIPVSIGGFSGLLRLNTFIRQFYGFTFDTKTPKFVIARQGRFRKKVGVRVTNVQILASFSPLTQADVSTATNTVTSRGSSVTGFFYLGDIIAPPSMSSCCGSNFNVAALITIELTSDGTTLEMKKFVSRKISLRCVQYRKCSIRFERMSEVVKCPLCEN